MALMRGFGRVEEHGTIAIPSNIGRVAGLIPSHVVEIEVIRVKGTSRRPHMLFHNPDRSPFVSPLEAVMAHGFSMVDGEGKIALVDNIWEEAKLKPGELVEMKVAGPRKASWVVIYNRGLGFRRRERKKEWPTMALEY